MSKRELPSSENYLADGSSRFDENEVENRHMSDLCFSNSNLGFCLDYKLFQKLSVLKITKFEIFLFVLRPKFTDLDICIDMKFIEIYNCIISKLMPNMQSSEIYYSVLLERQSELQ